MKLHLDSTRASAARKLLTAVLAVQTVALNFSPAWAAPAADALPEFQAGYADRQISREGGVLNITAGGDIKYASFNIGSEAEVHFVGGGTTVNKIYDANPSQIFGLLTADGKIYLLNANGILFGNTARVNVGGLVASTFMDVGNDAEGNLVFQGNPGNGDITVESGAVINAGAFAYLVGRNVNLGGAVNAGDVQVAAFGGEKGDFELTTANGGKIILKLGGNASTNGGSITITNGFTNADYSVVYTNESAQVLTNTFAVSNITLYAVSDISQVGTWEANAPVVALGAPSVKSSNNGTNTSSISAGGDVHVGFKYVSIIASNAETGVITTNFDWKPFGTTNISLAGNLTAGSNVWMTAGTTITLTNGTVEAVPGAIQLDGTVDAGNGLWLNAVEAGTISQGAMGTLKAGKDAYLDAVDGITLDGAVTTGGSVVLKAPSVTGAATGAIAASNNVYVGGDFVPNVVSNSGTGVVTTNLEWTTFGTTNIALSGGVSAGSNVWMTAGKVNATTNGDETVAGAIKLDGNVKANELQLETLGAGTIAQGTNGAVEVTGTTLLDAADGTITLGSGKNDFRGTVTATAAKGAVTLGDKDNITLGEVKAADLTVTSKGGTITQTADTVLTVTNATSLSASGDITLANGSNDFGGPVAASGKAVTLADTNAIVLSDVTATELKVDAKGGSITQTAAAKVTGATELDATGDITLDNAANDFTGAVAADGANVTLTDANSLLLGDVTANQDLNATAHNGSITQTTNGTVNVTGTTTLAATAGDIKLANVANDFTGAVSADGANVTLADANSLLLGDVTANQNLNATALNGSITQTTNGTVNVTGTTTLAATAGNILLANAGNDFGGEVKEATAADGSIALADKNSLELVAVTAGTNATLVAQGDLTVKNGATIEAGKDLALLSDGNITTEASSTLTGDNVVLVAATNVDLTTADIHGRNVGIEAKGGSIKDEWAEVQADETMILVAGDEVEIHSALLVTESLGVQAGGDITFDNLNVENFAATSTGGDVTVDTIGDVNLAGGGKVEAVRADGATNVVVDASGLNGIQAAQDVDLTAYGLAVSGTQVVSGGDTDLTVADYSVGNTAAGGNLIADLGNAAVGSMTAGNLLNATVQGNLAASGQVGGGGETWATVGGAATVGTLSGGNIDLETGGPATISTLTGNQVEATVGGNADIHTMNTTGPVDLDVTGATALGTSSVGGPLTIVSGGALTSDQMTVNGKLDTDAGGATTLKKTTVHGDAEIKSSGTLTFDQLTANNVKVTKSGSIRMGKLNTGTADLRTSGSITDNGSLAKVRTLTMTAGGDIGSAGKPINLEVSSKIEQISGKNVYLVEQSSGHDIVLGTINASGHLSLTAPRIGLPNGQYGFVDGNGDAVNLHAGSGLELDIAGFFGQPGNPMEAEVNGDWILRSGDLHGMSNGDPSTGTPLNLIYMVFGNTLYTVTPVYDGNGPIPGLVIVNGRPVQGHPDLLRKIHSALAFTADTPELKSTQGVFGNPLFLHTDLALTDMGALGLVDYLTFMNLTRRRPDAAPVWDAMVDDFTTLFEKWDIAGEGQFPSKDQKTPYNQPALLIMPATPSGGQAAKNPPAKPAEKPHPVQGAAPQDRVAPSAKGQPTK